MKLVFEQNQLDTMQSWLEQHYPHEACGFFTGSDSEGTREIGDLWSVDNKSTENLRRRFVIDPLDYMKAENKADEANTNLLGLFHSHPDHPAFPSEHDLAAAQPYFSYVIVSVKEGKLDQVRSFRLKEGQFVEEEVIIKQS